MLTDAAIIGGTGVGETLAQMPGIPIHIPTPAGQLAGRLVHHATGPILAVNRHSAGHKVPPHLVNYKAISLGLKKAGVRFCFSTAAVGSLRRDWTAGTFALVSDFWDVSGRNQTLFDREVVHTDFTHPVSPTASAALLRAASILQIKVEPSATYVCGNGPRYETPHEVRLLATCGDVVGMTAATEGFLAHEAGVGYLCLAIVTNLAAGLDRAPLDHAGVTASMLRAAEKALKLLLASIDTVRASQ